MTRFRPGDMVVYIYGDHRIDGFDLSSVVLLVTGVFKETHDTFRYMRPDGHIQVGLMKNYRILAVGDRRTRR